ncbi:MAG: hypothetical protein CVV27_15660 [Candidatus Melainabacteria bacterium HGW-Melainabacteria-1]|nr:MAG: hypothetical protein CVV27_15660 [Candidatus Melainabacteria bacterium HGW-Melainabacteria-1]
MSQIGPGPNPYGPPPMGQQPGYPQPVVYRPSVPGAPMMPGAYGTPDQYRPGMPPTGPVMGPGGQPVAGEKPYEYVAQKDVAFGILGAVGGYFAAGLIGLSGPIGALILGITLLGLSAITRAVKHNQDKKAAQQAAQPPVMPQPPNYPQPAQYQNRYNYDMTPQSQDPRYRQ